MTKHASEAQIIKILEEFRIGIKAVAFVMLSTPSIIFFLE